MTENAPALSPDFSGQLNQVIWPKTHLAALLVCFCIAVTFWPSRLVAAATVDDELAIDIVGMSIEDLLEVSVTSVAKKKETYANSGAAIYVLTGEDIRRSGVTNLPDALRLVPGVMVAKIDASKWAVSIRGFNGRTANKILVLIDGRTVYDPLFSGTFWEAQDVVLEDIERIEVIRGPGGAVWGANAVNGVINIITKSAFDTEGGLAIVGSGSEERVYGTLRSGAKISEKAALRVYSKYFRRDDGYSNAATTYDDWNMLRGGFRVDWWPRDDMDVILRGEVFDGQTGEPVAPILGQGNDQDVQLSGGKFVWQYNYRPKSEHSLGLLGYYDYFNYDNLLLAQRRHNAELELVHQFKFGERQEFVWGPSYRLSSDSIRNSAVLQLLPEQRIDQVFAVFLNDDIIALVDLLKFTLGLKLEHNDYSGFEVQPNLGATYTPSERHTAWLAASRAVRTPSRLEQDVVIPGLLQANRNINSEVVWTLSAGHRMRPVSQLSFDSTVFYSKYERLLSVEGIVLGNKLNADSAGFEAVALYQPLRQLRMDVGYTLFSLDATMAADSLSGAQAARLDGADPLQQAFLRVAFSPNRDWQFDGVVRYVGELESLAIDAYATADLRASWNFYRDFWLTLVGRNLAQSHHFEQAGAAATAVERSVHGQVEWRR